MNPASLRAAEAIAKDCAECRITGRMYPSKQHIAAIIEAEFAPVVEALREVARKTAAGTTSDNQWSDRFLRFGREVARDIYAALALHGAQQEGVK